MISTLASKTIFSPNHYIGRNAAVTKVTIHHMAGCLTAEQCGAVFKPTSRNASSNYGIGPDGEIACYVDEANAPWTSRSAWNDNRAVTIEVSNSREGVANGTWAITDASYRSLIALCADICKRYGIVPAYDGTKYASFTEHRMFAATGCPGPWIHDRMGQIVADVKSAMEPPKPAKVYGYSAKLWNSNNSAMQHFKIEQADGGWVKIRNVGRNMYLDVKDGSKANDTPVRVWEKTNGNAQLWKLIPVQRPYALLYELEPKCAPGLRLDAKGGGTTKKTGLQTHKSNGTAAQRWQFIDSGDGVLRIVSSKSGLAIDAGDGVQ